MSNFNAGRVWDLLDLVSDTVLNATTELEGPGFRCIICKASGFEDCAQGCVGAFLQSILVQSETLKELLEKRYGVEDDTRGKFD